MRHIPADRTLKADYLQRRKREKLRFLNKYKREMLWISRMQPRPGHFVDWTSKLHLPEVQSIITKAREQLVYSFTTDDYSIWMVLMGNFNKHFLFKKSNGEEWPKHSSKYKSKIIY